MYRDYKDLLCAFHAHGVRYLTRDIDFYRSIKADLANAQATYAALASFGAPLEGIRPEEFADRGSFFRITMPFGTFVGQAPCLRRPLRPPCPSPSGSVISYHSLSLLRADRKTLPT